MFKTGDCTFQKHFGYAYIDVNSECSGTFVGATYCPDDTAVSVTAPFGYARYTWYDSSLTQLLGTSQTLTLTPPPPSGTTVAVKLEPYDGYGCPQTMFAQLLDTLKVRVDAGKDTLSCNSNPVPIGVPPKPNLLYSWTPVTGLNNPNIANPLAGPPVTTSYVIQSRSIGGGCRAMDTVVVKVSAIDSSLKVIGKAAYCINSGDSTVLQVQPTDSIQWFKDGRAIARANATSYRAYQAGTYYAMLFNKTGCILQTRQIVVSIDQPATGIRYPLKYAVVNYPLALKARSIGESALWNPALYLNDSKSYAPVFVGPRDMLYTIALTTASGCVTVDTQQVNTISGVEVYVPSAFTPNNDGKNDVLRPITKGIKSMLYFRVYNRWGQLLFETKEEQLGWNGLMKGLPQQTGAVVWMFEGTGVDDKVYVKKGTTVLIR